MSVRNLLRFLTSARLTVALLCLLAVLLLLNVALPQESLLGEERFAQIVEGRPAFRFLLVTLGLGLGIGGVLGVMLALAAGYVLQKATGR